VLDIKVRNGDSLWKYSQLFMIPLQLIIDSNPSTNPASLSIGATVKIPGFQIINYNIKRGDTLWKLARARNLNVDALYLLNQDKNVLQLQIGDVIRIPRRVTSAIVRGQQAYSSNLLKRDIASLESIYPFIRVKNIGTSVLEKPIYEIKIGNGQKKVHVDASFHANEWITSPILMTFLNEFVLSLTNGTAIRGVQTLPIYSDVTISFVPMVNPDGVDLVIEGPPSSVRQKVLDINNGSSDFTGWKANINGVDLNNQYPAKWELEKERKEEKAPAPRDFPGYKPLSEPEATAMAELAREESFDRLLALHTQGQEFYWGYEGLEPPESSLLAEDFERVSGYRSVRYVDSYAGYKDWFIQEFQNAGFTVELGKGINPLPLSQFNQIYQDILGIFLVSLYRW
jgi:g-D-glutamyl-meso-diaminopimelate peptidase